MSFTLSDSAAQKLCDMTAETTILVCKQGGKFEFDNIVLSKDVSTVTCNSKLNNPNVKNPVVVVDLKNVGDIIFGQHTDKFKKGNRRDFENFSFSVFYSNTDTGMQESLDLVAKNEEQFQQWTQQLQLLTDMYKLNASAKPEVVAAIELRKPRVNVSSNKAVRMGKAEKNEIYSFGWNNCGQNPTGKMVCSEPVMLDALIGKGSLQVSAGWAHTVVVLDNGGVMQQGHHSATGSTAFNTAAIIPSLSPPVISEIHRVQSVSCGNFHTLALTESGNIFSWGVNVFGQLGHGDHQDRREPVMIEAFSKDPQTRVVSVASGGQFSLAVVSQGGKTGVYSWGMGERGALGHQNNITVNTPKAIRDLDGVEVEFIAAGDHHATCTTKQDIYAWGNNDCGQLGLGDDVMRNRPVNIKSLKDCPITSISCGASHTVVIALVSKLNAKFVYSWGLNNHGQLGFESKTKIVNKPTAVVDLVDTLKSPIVEVECGYFHTLARDSDGDILSCGSNKYGQLGVSNTTDHFKFSYIDGLKGKNGRRLCGGGEHSLVLNARAWVDDSDAKECMSCKEAFSMLTRKHHCRYCLAIFCGKCSSKKIAILEYELLDPVRVCNNCYKQLGGR